MGIGNPIHLIFLGAIALVVLGPKRLPEVARALGKGLQEFRDSMNEAVRGEDTVTPVAPQILAASQVSVAQTDVVDEPVVPDVESSSGHPPRSD